MRRLLVPIISLAFSLATPVAAFAANNAPEKPSGTDHTLTTIFVVAVGLPALLAVLTLIDIAVGKHTKRDH